MVGPYIDSYPGRRRRALAGLMILLAVACGLGAGCRQAPPTVEDLDSLAALQSRFNADAGQTRIVLLLSPT